MSTKFGGKAKVSTLFLIDIQTENKKWNNKFLNELFREISIHLFWKHKSPKKVYGNLN